MDPDNLPSTSKRAKYLKYASEKLNASNKYPVTFDVFRKYTNVDEYVVSEMERSGPKICRINYSIRHEYYPIVFKKFYESKSVREKMLRRGLAIKPIPKFLKEKLLRLPGDELLDSCESKENNGEVEAKTTTVQTKPSMIATAISPAYKISGKSKQAIKKPPNKDVRRSSKTIGKTTLKNTPGQDDAVDSVKITDFFSALKLKDNSDNVQVSEKDRGVVRKRKHESTENSPEVEQLKEISLNTESHKSKEPPTEVKRITIGPKSKQKRKTKDGGTSERKKTAKKSTSNNRRKSSNSPVEDISDDSDIHSNVEKEDLRETKSIALSRSDSASSQSIPEKSPLPKRNRIENFRKLCLSPKKSAVRKNNCQSDSQSSSDVDMPLLSLSGLVQKTTGQVSCEIQDWLSKANLSADQSDDESDVNFLEEEFRAVDKLSAIKKYPNEVKNYIKYLLNAEIQRLKIANITNEKQQGVTKSKVVAAFLEMTFSEYKDLINADKIYAQGLLEQKTSQEITSDLSVQYESIINRTKAWPRNQHVKLSVLKNFLLSKGLKDPVDLRCIPPRLLSFEEVLEHTNLKEFTSLSRSQPPGSYKQLLSLSKRAYQNCCLEGVWTDGLYFTDLSHQKQQNSQFTQSEDILTDLPTTEEFIMPSNKLTNPRDEIFDKNLNKQESGTRKDAQTTQENAENREKRVNTPENEHSENDIEQMMDQIFAESETKITGLMNEGVNSQFVAKSQLNSEVLPDSQPVLGYIPPSPALFQSSSESEQRTQISDSQQIEAHPPEAVFVPCDRSMVLNTEENNLTVMSVDQDSNTQDPFAESSDISKSRFQTTEQTSVLECVVKNEPVSANNTQNSYNPFDDSVQILDIPPSEPIVIEDEESAPELLEMLLTKPRLSESTFLPPNLLTTQSSDCMETFVHAQQLSSNLSSLQSQQNPSQLHEEAAKDRSVTESDGGDGIACDLLRPLSAVKIEKEVDADAELNLIMTILKAETEESVQIPEQTSESALQSQPTVQGTRDGDHCYSIDVHSDNEMSNCVFIPPQRIPSEVESTQNPVSIISLEKSTFVEPQQQAKNSENSVSIVDLEESDRIEQQEEVTPIDESVNADNQDAPGTSGEISGVNEGGGNNKKHEQNQSSVEIMEPSLVSVYEVSTQNEVDSEIVRDSHDEISVSLNTNLDTSMSTADSRIHAELITNQQIDLIFETAEEDRGQTSEVRLRVIPEASNVPVDCVAEKNNESRKDLNDNLPVETLHLAVPPNTDSHKSQEVEASSIVRDLNVVLQANTNVFVGGTSPFYQNELFVGCNLEVNTVTPQTDRRSQIEPMEVAQEDDELGSNQAETIAAQIVEQKLALELKAALVVETDEPQARTLSIPAIEENPKDILSSSTDETPENLPETNDTLKESENIAQKGEDVELQIGSTKTNLNAVETNHGCESNTSEGSRPISPNQNNEILSECERENAPNSERDMPPCGERILTKVVSSALDTETLNQNKEKTYVLPALLPIAAFKSNKFDEFMENPGMEDDPEIGDEKDDLVEVPVLINRRFIKMLPFNIVTPQQIQQTTKESTIYAIKTKLELCLQELVMSDPNGEHSSTKTNQAEPKQTACLNKQINATEDDTRGETNSLAKPPIKDSQVTPEKTNSRITIKKSKEPISNYLSTETTNIKSTPSTKSKKKKASPKKGVKRPQAQSLDFVPQKTHAFRSLALSSVAKKNVACSTRSKTRPNDVGQSNTEELNYNIEDVSQAVASSTASQILGTDCTYFESSQLLRNIEGCPQTANIQEPPPEDKRKTLTHAKVNTFDRISLSEGLTARRLWQVNLKWKARQKMSIEVRFTFNKHSLTVCDNSAQLLFNFSTGLWSDILRVLREIDHFEYKRLAVKNYQAATPLHKALRYLFDSASQVVNVKLTIDSHDPYASCEEAKRLYRKPFQCLTKAIAPNILTRMKGIKDRLKENVLDE